MGKKEILISTGKRVGVGTMTITVNEDHILISLEHTIMYQINNVVFSKIHNDLNLVVPKMIGFILKISILIFYV